MIEFLVKLKLNVKLKLKFNINEFCKKENPQCSVLLLSLIKSTRSVVSSAEQQVDCYVVLGIQARA
jgi:hypothetical protein